MSPSISVSVCIPTYNGAEFLHECIDSIISQTLSNFELLIVDDQSSDRTLAIAQEYAVRDSRIKLIENPENLGLVGNWNRCIELATGEWIKFVFQDDIIEPTCLEKLLAATKFGKPIIYCQRDFIFEAGTHESTKEYYLNHLSLQNPFSDTVEISAQQYAEVAIKNIGVNFVGEPTSVMLHRSVFSQFGTFNPHLIMICDFEFCTRVAIHTGIIQVPEVLAHFRVHGTASSAVSNINRQYRGWVLDGLILIHDFAFHALYTPIRIAALQLNPPLNLAQLFKQRTFLAWRIARREQQTSKISTFSSHLELEKVSTFYPLITSTIETNNWERIKAMALVQIDISITSIKNNIKKVVPITQIKAKFAKGHKKVNVIT
jgi:glycosyltransferase involved in cell wall biosynthesis